MRNHTLTLLLFGLLIPIGATIGAAPIDTKVRINPSPLTPTKAQGSTYIIKNACHGNRVAVYGDHVIVTSEEVASEALFYKEFEHSEVRRAVDVRLRNKSTDRYLCISGESGELRAVPSSEAFGNPAVFCSFLEEDTSSDSGGRLSTFSAASQPDLLLGFFPCPTCASAHNAFHLRWGFYTSAAQRELCDFQFRSCVVDEAGGDAIRNMDEPIGEEGNVVLETS